MHIVQAIRKETDRARVEWETFLYTPSNEIALEDGIHSNEQQSITHQLSCTESLTKSPDNYCFEMLSMVIGFF